MKNGTGDIDHNEANTDWFDELLHTALQHTHDISITGGNDRVQYVGTVGYAKQDGIIESSYERYNTRLNTTANLADWLLFNQTLLISMMSAKRVRTWLCLLLRTTFIPQYAG